MDDTVAGSVRSGRRIVLDPVPPGFWAIVGGALVMALGPMFGLLAGSMIGFGDDGSSDALFLLLIIGILVGGIGLLALLAGVRRYYRYRRAVGIREDARPAS